MSLNWQSVPGACTYLSTWGKHAWCVNSAQDIFQWVNGQWIQRPGKAVQVSVGRKGATWVINAAHEIYQWNQYTQNWDRVQGALQNCSVVTNNDVWGCNPSQEIFHWNGQSWTKVDGACVQISAGKDGSVWCINRDQDIFRRQGVHGQWQKVDGKLTHVSVYDYNTAIGNNASHEIFQWHGHWVKCPGQTKHISVGKKHYRSVWGVNAGQQIWAHRG